MKYISVVLLVICLGWTWSLATAESTMDLNRYRHVESGVEEDVRAFIARRHPNTTEIFCPQLYTEDPGNGFELIARFRCHALSGQKKVNEVRQEFEGYLRLRSDDGFETWAETGGEINSKDINFIDGIEVRKGDGAAAGDESDQESQGESVPAAGSDDHKP